MIKSQYVLLVILYIYNYSMNDEEKAQQYSNLTYGFDRIANEIASIKGESIDLNQEQQVRIHKLQEQQGRIMAQLQQIMNGQ